LFPVLNLEEKKLHFFSQLVLRQGFFLARNTSAAGSKQDLVPDYQITTAIWNTELFTNTFTHRLCCLADTTSAVIFLGETSFHTLKSADQTPV
jgi:hypothetical protein